MFHAIATAIASAPLVMAEPNLGGAIITPDMLTPLVDGLTANIGVVLPVGIGVMAIFIGIKFIPKMIKLFLNT